MKIRLLTQILLCITGLYGLLLGIQKNVLDYNFTALSSLPNTFIAFYIFLFLIIITAILSFQSIIDKYHLIKPNKHQFIILALLFLGTGFIQYDVPHHFSAFLHVTLAYLTFIYFNYLLFTTYNFMKLQQYPFIHKYAFLYMLLFTVCLSMSIVYGSIHTLCELVYLLGSCTLLFFFIR